MKKKIYTFIATVFTISLIFYFVWVKAAEFQTKEVKNYLFSRWGIEIENQDIITTGFPLRFISKISNFRSELEKGSLSLEFAEVKASSFIYDLSKVIFSIEEPKLSDSQSNVTFLSAENVKGSISDMPFSGNFKLITEHKNWEILKGENIPVLKIEKAIFAVRDKILNELEFHFHGENFSSKYLDEFVSSDTELARTIILKGNFVELSKKKLLENEKIPLQSIEINYLKISIDPIQLVCNGSFTLDIFSNPSEKELICDLALSTVSFSKFNPKDSSIKQYTDILKLMLILNGTSQKNGETLLPLKFYIKNKTLYVNGLPLYKF